MDNSTPFRRLYPYTRYDNVFLTFEVLGFVDETPEYFYMVLGEDDGTDLIFWHVLKNVNSSRRRYGTYERIYDMQLTPNKLR